VGRRLLRIQARSAQYECWLRGHDLWTAIGSLVQWLMAKSYGALSEQQTDCVCVYACCAYQGIPTLLKVEFEGGSRTEISFLKSIFAFFSQ
jgi:hypothetical protein